MTTTARQATRTIATHTLAAAELAISGFESCEICDTPAAYLYTRLDEDGCEVHVCEPCADTVDLGCVDCD